ncbi:GrpB family protein [Deinococcus hopiensis]|uniref:GrpB domain, predicted nucleotidyltransferase, UPF0157 family n=1 Tax=Deinococcus hopiensis KR-140 TaxID=695939 RepID=A0A1W1VDF9_9DEIO|nr:GrpB family protein [Deinococcus hopiensis]SMB91240.1 GrpB domain, predicted nucleotidyltransferase, UPF0157 family [Deinococcus hopiensis KR-140]
MTEPLTGPLAPKRLQIVSADPGWPVRFQTFAQRLREVLGKRALSIHHIGSTSVPGLAAKDVLDVQVTVRRLEDADLWLPELAALGLQTRSEVQADDARPSLNWPESELAKRYASEPRRTHVHLRELGRANQRYALLMRDYLRANAGAAAAYGGVKVQLAHLHGGDVDAYYAVKNPVMDLIVAAAEDWADRVGWALPPSDA